MRVFITGGTGLIGTQLVQRLRQRNDEAVVLTRRPEAAKEKMPEATLVEGDPTEAGRWIDQAVTCDAVINLAGENIFAKRWNDDFKRRLTESRVKSTEHVVQALTQNPQKADGTPKVLVNASAVGYYGPHGEEEIDENSPPGNDYLAKICVDWEKAALAAKTPGIRVALVRIGVVLDPQGGALAKLLTPFKLGAGGPAGSGKQWMPWIHIADVVGILLLALDNSSAHGPINAVAPNPVTNKEFSKTLGKTLGRPAFMPTPSFGLKLMLGEVASVVLEGQRVLPKQAQELGYTFQFPKLEDALANLLK